MLGSSPRQRRNFSSLRPRRQRQRGSALATGGPRADPALPPRSLVQALLTVLSQVLCFLAIEWYLPLLVCSLALGWVNLLYYTRGLQHTGIYSVMIQKVRGRGGPVQPDRAGTPGGSSWARQAGASPKLNPPPARAF